MVIALVGVKEHEHAEVAEVALSKSMLVQAVNLGVCQYVPNSLNVHYHQIAMSVLPGEVAECLGYQGLVRVLLPPCIVVVLLVLPRDVGLTVVVLVRGTLCGNLVDEGLDELNEIFGVNL